MRHALSGIWGDIKLATRQMRRSRSYFAVAVLTLGVGIGATTAIFSVVDGVLLRPLPYPDPAELVLLTEEAPKFGRISISYPDFVDWEKMQRSFTALGCYTGASYNLVGKGQPERLRGIMMSSGLLAVLATPPPLGRAFTADEDREGGPAVALLGHAFWQRQFGGAADVVGKTINLGGVPHTVVGVLPADFQLITEVDVATPIGRMTGPARERGNHPGILAVGRLAPGVSLERAREDLQAIGRTLGQTYPDSNTNISPRLVSLRASIVSDVRPMLLVLMGAVVFVLLVSILNVANLALARATMRRRDMVVRAALGAGRYRLVREVLVESLLISVVGGMLGVLLALWGVDVLAAMRPDAIPREMAIRVDGGVLVFSILVSAVAGLVFGLVPAFQATHADVNEALKQDARTMSGGRRQGRTRNALVVFEVALALMVLVGAGLSLRAFVKLAGTDLGFVPENVVTMTARLPKEKYDDPTKLRTFLTRLGERVRALPGVESASLSAGLPLSDSAHGAFTIEGELPLPPGSVNMTVYFPTDGEYLRTLRLRLLRGRFLTDADDADRPLVVVIDEVTARTFFGDRDPIGRRLLLEEDRPLEIVGVVGHVTHYGLGEPEFTGNQIYLPWRQVSPKVFVTTNSSIQITLRAAPGVLPESLAPEVGRTVASLDPDQPVHAVRTMRKLVDDSLGGRRFAMILLGVFAAIALVLAVVGLYSVVSYLVAQRTHELGVRMALGARARDVERMVLVHAARLVALGLSIGVAGAFALTGLMRSLLYGVEPTDPVTFAAVAALLSMAAMAASWLPARRAARVDPMVALRGD